MTFVVLEGVFGKSWEDFSSVGKNSEVGKSLVYLEKSFALRNILREELYVITCETA